MVFQEMVEAQSMSPKAIVQGSGEAEIEPIAQASKTDTVDDQADWVQVPLARTLE